ncbi:hypothetical protein GALL_57420 [mine drainage metagenome]|uniref:Uncharacterized protein n=1 Tax=mine drainage metagenome TaxID=410659 RepID=A0A1J5SXJ4_9ZZZZ
MNDFDFAQFYNTIQKDLAEASRFKNEIEREYWGQMYFSGEDLEYDEQLEFNKEMLIETFEAIKLKFDLAYEYLSLTRMSEKLETELKKYKGKFADLEYFSYVDIFYSPVEVIFLRHLNALTSHVKLENENEYETINSFFLLERILRGTSKMLSDRKIEPANETEVKNEVYKTLIHVFPDTVREIPIAKVSKTYKPDIGIKRLKSAIEYKFASSAEETKTAIGGIFEDINGYEGSKDWTTFYSVIYMTDSFMTQDQVEAEFKLSNVPHHWKPIVVYGHGKRVKATKKRKTVLHSPKS